MERPFLLGPNSAVNGPQVITVRVRPRRTAFVVPVDNATVAARAIDSCCLTWGGLYNPIIPYSPADGFTDEWVAVLETTDPDAVVDMAGISDSEKKWFEESYRRVRTWPDSLNTLEIPGAMIYSAMHAFVPRPAPTDTIVLIPSLSQHDPLYLPLIARYGRLRQEGVDSVLNERRWRSGVRYAEFVPIQEFDVENEPEEVLLGTLVPPVASQNGIVHYRDLPGMTLLNLNRITPSITIGSLPPERTRPPEQYAPQIVITGDHDSVADLAAYWTLRATRRWARPFPLWIPLDVLASDLGERVVGIAQQRTRELIKGMPGPAVPLHIISMSRSQHDIRAQIGDRFRGAVVGSGEIRPFLMDPPHYHLTEENREVQFRQGTARVPLSRPEALDRFAPGDSLGLEIQIEGVDIPRITKRRNLAHALLGRVTSKGARESLHFVSDWPSLESLTVPDGWTIISDMFRDRGYRIEPSDKAPLAVGLLQLLGGITDVSVLASSLVYDMLRTLSTPPDTTRRFQSNRRTIRYHEIQKLWGTSIAKVLVQWLVDRRILFRGAVVECGNCRLKRWYSIDDLSESWRCQGCQSGRPVPLNLDTTTWAYRINELYAAAHDQGAITPLLTMRLMRDPMWLAGSELLGCYPGICITQAEDADVPIANVEIDIVAIISGRLAIVECKDSGETLSEAEVRKLVTIANHLECSRLIFVTPTTFPQADELFPQAEATCSARVEWWEGPDLFDGYPFESISDNRASDDRTKEYLERVARRLHAGTANV